MTELSTSSSALRDARTNRRALRCTLMRCALGIGEIMDKETEALTVQERLEAWRAQREALRAILLGGAR